MLSKFLYRKQRANVDWENKQRGPNLIAVTKGRN